MLKWSAPSVYFSKYVRISIFLKYLLLLYRSRVRCMSRIIINFGKHKFEELIKHTSLKFYISRNVTQGQTLYFNAFFLDLYPKIWQIMLIIINMQNNYYLCCFICIFKKQFLCLCVLWEQMASLVFQMTVGVLMLPVETRKRLSEVRNWAFVLDWNVTQIFFFSRGGKKTRQHLPKAAVSNK